MGIKMKNKRFLSVVMTLIFVFNTFSCLIPLSASASNEIDAFEKPIRFIDCDETDVEKTGLLLGVNTKKGSYVLFKNVNFGGGAVSMTVNYAWPENFTDPKYPAFYLDIYLDDKGKTSPDYKAQIYSKHTSGWEDCADLEIEIPPEVFNGTHDLYIVFNARSNTAGNYNTISFADRICTFKDTAVTLKDNNNLPVNNFESASAITAETEFRYKAADSIFLKYSFFFYDSNSNYISTITDDENEYSEADGEVYSKTVDIPQGAEKAAVIVYDSDGHIYRKGGIGYNFNASTDNDIKELTVTQNKYGFVFEGVCKDNLCDTVIAVVKYTDGDYLYVAPLTPGNGTFEHSFTMPNGAASIKNGLKLYIYENGQISAEKVFSYKNPDDVKEAIDALTKKDANIEEVLSSYKDDFEIDDVLLNNIIASENKDWIYKSISDRAEKLTNDANFAEFPKNVEKIYLLSVLMTSDDCYVYIEQNKEKLGISDNENFVKHFGGASKIKFNSAFNDLCSLNTEMFADEFETVAEQSTAVALLSDEKLTGNARTIIDDFSNVLDFEQLYNYNTIFSDEQKGEVCAYILENEFSTLNGLKALFDSKAKEIYNKILENTVDARLGIELAKFDETSASDIDISKGVVPVVPAGTYFLYENVNFGSHPLRCITLNYAVPNDSRYYGADVKFYIDSKDKSEPDFTITTRPTTTNTTDWYAFNDNNYIIPSVVGEKLKGIHDIYMVTTKWASANFKSAKFSDTYKEVSNTKITLKKDGETVEKFGEADSVNVTASVHDFTGENKKITMLLGIYDKNNSLAASIQADAKKNVDEQAADFLIDFDLPKGKNLDSCYAVALLFSESNGEFSLYCDPAYVGENRLSGSNTDKNNPIKMYDSAVKMCLDFGDNYFGKGMVLIRPSNIGADEYQNYLLAGTTAITDGVLSIDFTIPESFATGDYSVYVLKDGKTEKYENLFYYTNQNDVDEALKLVKESSANETALKECLNNRKTKSGEYVKKLLSVENTLAKINNSDRKDDIYKGIAAYIEKYDNTVQRKSEFINCVNSIYAQNLFYTDALPSDVIDEYNEALELADKITYTKYYSNTEKDAFNSKFKLILGNSKKINDNESFLNVFELTQALCSIESAMSWGTVASVFNDFDNVLKLSELPEGKNLNSFNLLDNSQKRECCNGFLGETVFNSKSDVVNMFEKQYPSSGGSSGGSGSSSSGGKKGSVSMGGITPDITDEPDAVPDVKKDIFDDLSGYEWAKESIKTLSDKGIVSGIGDNKFNPGGNIKREEFTKLVMSVFGKTEEFGDVDFEDVDRKQWYFPYIVSAQKNNIIYGKDGKFGVGEFISRQDACVILYRACVQFNGYIPTENKVAAFVDTDDISEYAREAVTTLARAGIINGFEDGSFAPKNCLTRAESAKLIYSLMSVNNG